MWLSGWQVASSCPAYVSFCQKSDIDHYGPNQPSPPLTDPPMTAVNDDELGLVDHDDPGGVI